MALFWRVWVAVSAVNLMVLTLFVSLTSLQFDNVNTGLVADRLKVLAARTVAPFAAASRIGLPLSTVRNANALLERARQTDSDILEIAVFDDAGTIVHNTSKDSRPVIPEGARAVRKKTGTEIWHFSESGRFYAGADILRGDGSDAGGILIVYPTQSNTTQIRAMAAEIGLAAIVVFILSAGLSGLLLKLGLRRQIHDFDAIENSIEEFEYGAWRSAAGGMTARANFSALGTALNDAEAQYRATGAAMPARDHEDTGMGNRDEK